MTKQVQDFTNDSKFNEEIFQLDTAFAANDIDKAEYSKQRANARKRAAYRAKKLETQEVEVVLAPTYAIVATIEVKGNRTLKQGTYNIVQEGFEKRRAARKVRDTLNANAGAEQFALTKRGKNDYVVIELA